MKLKKTVAVLLTCHNRKETTLQCLKTLFSQTNIEDIKLEVLLVDDGSTDGTGAAVSQKYPEVQIIQGDGSLYWTGGMRKVMDIAYQKKYNFYLWLNDDTVLYPNALEVIFNTYTKVKKYNEKPPIVSGNLCDPKNKEVSYGGYVHASKWRPLRFKRLEPSDEPKECDVVNGNVVLLPSSVLEQVGNLDAKLEHAGGDFDYSLRAKRLGFPLWITDKYVGECSRNSIVDTWKDLSLPLFKRYEHLFSKKGAPLYPRLIFHFKHGGIFWPIYFASVYIRPLLDSLKRS